MTAHLMPDLLLVPAGDFLMGAPDGEEDERPVHPVHLDDFLIGVQPVTHAEYAHFVRDTGHRVPAVYELPLLVTAGGDERERDFRSMARPYTWSGFDPPADRADHPVTLVRYDDATAYCTWLSATTGRVFRLPTEAEWEKAARGGIEGQRRYPWGDQFDPGMANFLEDASRRGVAGTTPCRKYAPNDLGVYDMAGNAWEWVHDWYDAAYYTHSARRNPAGPPRGTMRIVRGGSWLASDLRMLTCAHRHKVPPDTYAYSIGFRVACAS
jgi:formylglycine-generating enzyme required for sulfatase activity